ncbi:MAG: extracellular solute-binding protein [Dermatophilaceae bacterium]|nr:extracellular solute-binding protein [Dermatophilaceae bacterium]
MRQRRLTILVASAAVSASLVLAGCSGSGGSGSTGGNAGSGGAAQITFWQQQFEPYQQKWFKSYVDKFNASQTAVKVKLQVVPADTWAQKLKAAQAAGTQPDVATTNYGGIPAGVANGQFAQLDGLIPDKAWSDLKPNVSNFVQVAGKHYAYPMLVEPSTVLYYRTDLVKAAGLDPKSPPKTWAELLTWAEKLTNGNVKGMTIASVAPELGWSSWGLQYNACGHLPINDDWSAANAKDPCYTKLFELYQTLFQKGWMPQQPKVGYPDATPYGQGQVAMMANGSWAVGQLKQSYPKMIANTAVAAFPSVDGDPSKPTATLGGWTLTVDSKSKNKEAAAKFVDYLLAGDPAIMSDFFKQSGFSKYTVRTSVDEALAGDKDATADPFMKVISEQVVAHGKAEPAYPFDISLAFSTAIESVMKGKADIAKATQTANDAIDRVIKQQRLAGTAPQAG